MPVAVVRLDAESLGVTAETTGVMLNLTATDALGPGFLAAYPCSEGRPVDVEPQLRRRRRGRQLRGRPARRRRCGVRLRPQRDARRASTCMGTVSDRLHRRRAAAPARHARREPARQLALARAPARFISAGTVREWPHDLRRLRAPVARHRSDRDPGVARLARRGRRHARQDACPLPALEAARSCQRQPGQLPGHGQHAVRQHHPPRVRAVVPRATSTSSAASAPSSAGTRR